MTPVTTPERLMILPSDQDASGRTFGEAEKRYVNEALDSGTLTTTKGKFGKLLEQKFAEKFGAKYAYACTSGSAAIHIAVATVNPNPGDEIITTSITDMGALTPLMYRGVVPVFAEVDTKTLNVTAETIAVKISERTKAIIVTHLFGNPCEMDAIMALAKQHNLPVIEDSAQTFLAKCGDRYAGTIGDIGTYSFFFSHHITTIEGGMIVTPHDELAELLRCMRAHGWTRHLKNRSKVEAQYADMDPRFLFVSTGFNLRPTEINAAFGISQIKKLKGFNDRRREIAVQWVETFSDLTRRGELMPMKPNPGVECTWFGFPVLCSSREKRDSFKAHLESKNIETRPVICGNLARQPAFKTINHRISGTLTGADEVMDKGLFWGSHPIMTDSEVQYVSKTVKDFFK